MKYLAMASLKKYGGGWGRGDTPGEAVESMQKANGKTRKIWNGVIFRCDMEEPYVDSWGGAHGVIPDSSTDTGGSEALRVGESSFTTMLKRARALDERPAVALQKLFEDLEVLVERVRESDAEVADKIEDAVWGSRCRLRAIDPAASTEVCPGD